MKVFKSPCDDQTEINKMLAEAIILSRMGHVNIVRVFDAGIVDTRIGKCGYFTMEYITGTLEKFWRSYGVDFVPLPVVVSIGRQICEGMSVAHSSSPPIVHRDIKPQNIMVSDTGSGPVVKVSDFGLARNVNPLTLLASSSGTLAYKPPEYLANVDSCSGDVWAIGTTLYLLLTDKMPYGIDNDSELNISRHWKETLKLPSHYNKDVDPALDRIVAKALEKRAADRYPHAMAMLKDLNAWKPAEVPVYVTKTAAEDAPPLAYGMYRTPADGLSDGLVEKALRLATDVSRLPEAVALMEQALEKNPALRGKYSYRISLWKKGIMR